MAQEFTPVGRADDIPPGEMRSFQVGGEDIAIANVDGTFHAFGDVCTHAFCNLSDGDLEGTMVTCPCHASEFDVTSGEVQNGPAFEPVDTYDVQSDGGEIRVSI